MCEERAVQLRVCLRTAPCAISYGSWQRQRRSHAPNTARPQAADPSLDPSRSRAGFAAPTPANSLRSGWDASASRSHRCAARAAPVGVQLA